MLNDSNKLAGKKEIVKPAAWVSSGSRKIHVLAPAKMFTGIEGIYGEPQIMIKNHE